MSGVVVPLNKKDDSEGRKPGVEPLMALVANDMEKVNRVILSKCGSDVQMIPEVARHLIDSGGKRLRPMLTLAAARMSGYEGEHHVTLAASVEFMHTATLLHDDVVDESDLRRGKLSARKLWGNEASVLVGDFLLGQAFRMMVDAGSMKALEVLSTAATVIAEGEVMQLATAKNLDTTQDEYMQVVHGKTAALFAAATEVGPILAGSNKGAVSAFRSYGTNLGLAFQLIDDALDYGGSSKTLGKNAGDDFREGKVTLPVLLCYRRGSESQRNFWREAIERGETDNSRLEEAIRLMHEHDALTDTIERARHYCNLASDALAIFDDSPHKRALNEVLEFILLRAH
ncbi:MAG: polyprenyl synthetase family protein [Nitratireductor sp.]|nr:polyprenyl synthetase family protein [Nitratireductor sp.]MCC0020645.1 polyprenyl synthetase family protein [Nitratireductor sp.]